MLLWMTLSNVWFQTMVVMDTDVEHCQWGILSLCTRVTKACHQVSGMKHWSRKDWKRRDSMGSVFITIILKNAGAWETFILETAEKYALVEKYTGDAVSALLLRSSFRNAHC